MAGSTRGVPGFRRQASGVSTDRVGRTFPSTSLKGNLVRQSGRGYPVREGSAAPTMKRNVLAACMTLFALSSLGQQKVDSDDFHLGELQELNWNQTIAKSHLRRKE